MANVMLREPVTGKVTVERQVKPALYASRCDSCLLVFRMLPFCNDQNLGQLDGTFECGDVFDDDGDGLGNMFRATVCSFRCADEIMRGGWRRIEGYRPFVQAGALLARCEVKVTAYLRTEAELVADWEAGKPDLGARPRFVWCDDPGLVLTVPKEGE